MYFYVCDIDTTFGNTKFDKFLLQRLYLSFSKFSSPFFGGRKDGFTFGRSAIARYYRILSSAALHGIIMNIMRAARPNPSALQTKPQRPSWDALPQSQLLHPQWMGTAWAYLGWWTYWTRFQIHQWGYKVRRRNLQWLYVLIQSLAVFDIPREKGSEQGGRTVLCKSAVLQFAISHAFTLGLKFHVWHMHLRFERLPQPDRGRLSFIQLCCFGEGRVSQADTSSFFHGTWSTWM